MPRDRDTAKKARAGKAKQAQQRRRAAKIRRIQWSVLGVAGAAVLGFLVVQSSTGGVQIEGDAAIGLPAPAVEMTDFDGQTFELAEFEGKPLVLNFWASWCPNCIAEMPDFERVHLDLADQVAFLGVNQRDSRGAADDLAHETSVTYRLSEDPNGNVFDAFGGLGMPYTVFIDADGNMVDSVTGQLSESALRDFIDRNFGVASDA